MDEAFSAIDFENRQHIYQELLRQKNKTLIYVTHEISDKFLNHFDQVLSIEFEGNMHRICEKKEWNQNGKLLQV